MLAAQSRAAAATSAPLRLGQRAVDSGCSSGVTSRKAPRTGENDGFGADVQIVRAAARHPDERTFARLPSPRFRGRLYIDSVGAMSRSQASIAFTASASVRYCPGGVITPITRYISVSSQINRSACCRVWISTLNRIKHW